MKMIRVQDAVGSVLCHDLTRIVKDEFKGAQFKKGHIVTEEDIPMLLSMGKEHLYVWELPEGMLHEDDGAKRLLALCQNEFMTASKEIREGKVELFSSCDGLFTVDAARLTAVNLLEDVVVATRHGNSVVHAGDKLAGMRVIPLVVEEAKLQRAEAVCGGEPLLAVRPFRLQKAAVITTGSEVFHGRIEDAFTPVIEQKLAAVGMKMTEHAYVDDGMENLLPAIASMREKDVDLLLCTGGMSVDPDDNTPAAIQKSGAAIVSYGAPTLPGAMFLLGYYGDGMPVMGLPGCVMYAKATIFDLILPRVAAGVQVTKADLAALGNGGLCLGCSECHFPNCGYGK